MRTSEKLFAAIASVAAATVIAAVPAVADPISGKGQPVTPRASDIVGVGTGITQGVFDQFSVDYNKTVKASAPHLYSWDATNPRTGAAGGFIRAKAGCARAARPADSSEAIIGSPRDRLGLTADAKSSAQTFCTDFARSYRGREPNDPQAGAGGVQFVPFGVDAVTYATNTVTNAPADLSTAQLAEIYSCRVTNWARLGGKNARINAQLPPMSSETTQFFLTVLGKGRPIPLGNCVDTSPNEGPNNLPKENQGVSAFLRGPNVIYPYSIGAYLAEVYHSAVCLNKSCAPVKGVTCVPRRGQNRFGCDTSGGMVLHMINNRKPTVPFPLPKTCAKTGCPSLNGGFSGPFVKKLFVVVRWTAGTIDNIPAYLEPLFGHDGWVCDTRTAQTDLSDYGFGFLRPSVPATGGTAKPGRPLKMTC